MSVQSPTGAIPHRRWVNKEGRRIGRFKRKKKKNYRAARLQTLHSSSRPQTRRRYSDPPATSSDPPPADLLFNVGAPALLSPLLPTASLLLCRSTYLQISNIREWKGKGIDLKFLQNLRSSMIVRLVLGFLWCLMHLAVRAVHAGSCLIQLLLSFLISAGVLKKYKTLKLDKLKHLAVVFDSEEAKNTTKIKQLLIWLSEANVKYVILYDMEGVLKNTIGSDLKNLKNSSNIANCVDGVNNMASLYHTEEMTTEILSFSDGKEGVAKAANFLCSNYLKKDSMDCKQIEPHFTESDVTYSLKAVGCGGPEPDLLLVYGPARCHLGFPPWRLRYTEIIHMGSLKSMTYGAVLKALYDFSKKNQRYGK